jgi:2-polyprenyl-6-methoxyphenol hydroxylase-like FAD-dependent oxidoreductase
MGKLQVMVIGAGTGGLALTHGLRAAGIAVRAFERDHKLTDRLQGYKLTINARGAQALQSCLPKSNFARFIAASAKVSTAVSFFDHELRRLLSVGLPSTEQTAAYAARPISRVALREILFDGLEDVVVFGKTFESFEKTRGWPDHCTFRGRVERGRRPTRRRRWRLVAGTPSAPARCSAH